MEPLSRLASFWNWLPAFRAVAECLHLPTASRDLCVAPSALSRSIRLLERELGVRLFRRVGRRLELEDAGRHFLEALRDAMQLVHQASLDVRGELLSGPVRIASSGAATTTLLLPAIELLRQQHPKMQPIVTTPRAAEVAMKLRQGQLDIALHEVMGGLEGLCTESLGTLRSSVWCGHGHPLHGRTATAEELLQHQFVAPPPDASGQSLDGWPAAVPRTIAVEVDRLRLGLEICLRGELLAVLPDQLVLANPSARSLWRLPFAGIAEHSLFASMRPRLGTPTRADCVLQAVRAVHRLQVAALEG